MAIGTTHFRDVVMRGHIIDSLALPRAWGIIMDLGGNFNVTELEIGRTKDDLSYVRMQVIAPDAGTLTQIVGALLRLGAILPDEQDVVLRAVDMAGVLPEGFYSTTNLPTQVRVDGHWIPVEDIEMDVAIVVDAAAGRAFCLPMDEVRPGQQVVVGHNGLRVTPIERARDKEVFGFMQSSVSSEKVKTLVIQTIAHLMAQVRGEGGKILFVLGPAVIHTGAAKHIVSLIRRGYIQVIFGGNAILTHDVEAAIFGTSLGIDLKTGRAVEGGNHHHLRAVNTIRRHGSIAAAIEQGVLKEGIAFEAHRHGVEMVLAGSIRDDGPMPEVITDTMTAQRRMRFALKGVEMAVMVATMLHSIATGNLLPATVKTVAVDINPAVVTKLADRGTHQAVGLVTDAELFLRELDAALTLLEGLRGGDALARDDVGLVTPGRAAQMAQEDREAQEAQEDREAREARRQVAASSQKP